MSFAEFLTDLKAFQAFLERRGLTFAEVSKEPERLRQLAGEFWDMQHGED